MKVSELTDRQLDYWVAKSRGWINYPNDSKELGSIWHIEPDKAPFGEIIPVDKHTPSTNWIHCGELIEKYRLYLNPSPHGWIAIARGKHYLADTPHRAVCMAVIASVYGDEITLC